jgi:hypothetical protein
VLRKTKGMTEVTTRDEALEVLQLLTAEHANQPYFQNAEIVYNDGFFGVDMKVEGQAWRIRNPKIPIPPQINRVPICVMVYG